MAGTLLNPMGDRPIISITVDIVFAVYWPPHAPAPGHATFSSSRKFRIAHLSRDVCADGFVDVLNRHVFAAITAGSDRASVEHDAGKIHARQRHGRGGNGLITADDADDGVEHLSAANEFDRVGDEFTADQRRAHAFCAHGLAVGDGDGVELHGRSARFPNALFHFRRQAAQMKVAGHGFDPGVGHADQRTAEVGVGVSNSLVHRARSGAPGAFSDSTADVFEIHS